MWLEPPRDLFPFLEVEVDWEISGGCKYVYIISSVGS